MSEVQAISEVPSVSIIIPCYNGMGTIDACLNSLKACGCEVILVDSSSDGTDRHVAEHFPWVRLERFEERTLPGKGRNHGARVAEGELLAFLDADCVAPPDHLERVRRSFSEHPEQSAVVGCVENNNPGWISWLSFISEFNGFFGRQARRPMNSLPTYCAIYRKDVFWKYGGFPETLWPGEDAVFSNRLSAAGEPMFLDPSIRVRHHNRDTLREVLHHQRRIGKGFRISRELLPQLPGAAALRRSRLAAFPLAAARGLFMLRRTFAASPAAGLRVLLMSPLYIAGLWQFALGVMD